MNNYKQFLSILESPNQFIQVSKTKDNNVNDVSLLIRGQEDAELLEKFVDKFYDTHNMHWLGDLNHPKETRAGIKDIGYKTYTYFDIDGMKDMEYKDIVSFSEMLADDLSMNKYFSNYSAIVVSGGGIHIYMKIKPFKVDTYTKYMYQKMYELYADKLQELISGRLQVEANVDKTIKDISKNVRLPFSFNHKRQKPVTIIDVNVRETKMFGTVTEKAEGHKKKEQKRRNDMAVARTIDDIFSNDNHSKCDALKHPIQQLCERYGMQFNNHGFARSPFSNDSDPSFKIYKDTNTWYCWSTGQGGDTIDLVAKIEKLDLSRDFKKILSIINN